MTKENNQNWRNMYVLRFKTMAIIASCSFFIHMMSRNSNQKSILSFRFRFKFRTFESEHLLCQKESILQKDYQKDSIDGEKIKKIKTY
jgi:hypothetical protein